ncbi:hypothetical protein FE257_008854 [Aspergillus nanangensis]|uniref:Uncharacterized protein n=1 Tax=Aspergillus nanangensis TaxID=2582783 RepID=A0AAD4GSB1_ASPNN|nr:hypothetical protein FE257_008854 [Aspergillus nanangensis]
MHWEYRTLYSRTPRSFLFAVVADVGPGGASRPLAVAYRQHHEKYNSKASWGRVHHMVTDTLALIDILSDPANRAPLEAERALAEDWYRRSPHEPPLRERPSVPDTAQPPFVPWNRRWEPVQQQPPLPWRDDGLSQFPFTATCVLLALLRDDRAADATRPSDIQFQPLSTVFRADRTEYGLVVLDISDLDSGVKYGVVAFSMDYMAEVPSREKYFSWDPVEDPQPEKEPDIVLVSARPRALLSIAQWVANYNAWSGLEDHPSILRLEERPLADAAALDYIWPPELETPAQGSLKGVLSRVLKYFKPSKKDRSTPRSMVGYTIVDEPPKDRSMDNAKYDGSTTRASSVTWLDEPPQTVLVDIDCSIDDLLALTQEPTSPLREKQALTHLEILDQCPEKLRQRLEEVPDRLGPSMISSHVLRVAYSGHSHLNWVAFGSLPPRVIAAAVASDELRGASALSLCVNAHQLAEDGEEGESGLADLAVALAQSTCLKQLSFLQQPVRDHDDVSARFCLQLLRLWERASGGEDWEWLRSKTIHTTSAFLTGLRSRKFLTSFWMMGSRSSLTSGAQVFPMIYLFTFLGPQREDVHIHPARLGYSGYYSMDNTGLTADDFAVRFLGYLRALGPYSDPDKAILRVAFHGAFSSLASVDDDNEQHHRKHDWSPPRRPLSPLPLRSSPDSVGVRPIPAGLFDDDIAPDNPSRVRLGDIQPGSWVVLVDRRDRGCRASDDNIFLQYSFMRIRQSSAETAQEQQSSSVEGVGGLTDFLRETVPGTDIATWEKRVEEVENELISAVTRPSPPSTPSSIDFATGEERANESFRRAAEALAGMSASTPPPDMDRPTWEKQMQEVYRKLALYQPPTNPLSALPESDVSTGEEPVEDVEGQGCIGIRVMDESRAHALLDQLL